MKLLSLPKNISRSVVISSLSTKLPQLFDSRSVNIAKLSGYPAALHSIGRLQRLIDASSLTNLLESIRKIQSIAAVTADVIDNLDGTKMDKYQMNRTEIVSYIQNITSQSQINTLTEDDVDLIANLVTSFEANASNWILQGATDDSNLHKKFYELYKVILLGDDLLNLPAYASHDDTVKTFGTLPHIEVLLKPKKKGKQQEAQDTSVIPETVKNAGTIYRLALCKVVDHVYQLLLDKDIWYTFVAPRAKADLVTNQARSQSLRLLYTYCQSLLTYYQFFTMEMFLSSYDLVQHWITQFPPLESSVMYELENVVRKHDLLDAQGDVRDLIASFSLNAKSELDALVFPSEFLSTFGMLAAVKDASDRAADYTISGDLSNIGDLADPKFIPLLSGTSVSVFDATADLTTLLITDKLVSHQIRQAMIGLIPSFSRGSRKQDIDAVKALMIRASLPFVLPFAPTYQVVAGVSKGIENGVLSLDSGSPQYSYDYHQWLRDNMKFMMKTDLTIAGAYNHFDTLNVCDFDKAQELRGILGVSWKTLIPSTWDSGDYSYPPSHYMASYDDMRRLLESMSGLNYEVLIRELTLPHIQQMWATIMSSFGLLYVNPTDAAPLLRHDSIRTSSLPITNLVLVEGHGAPYGSTYAALASIQPPLTEKTEFLKIGPGLYIRFLEFIPQVVNEIKHDTSFYNQRPILYFSANSAKTPVGRWIIGDSLLNFSLVPTSASRDIPRVKITPRSVYLTQKLFINFNLFYKPAAPEKARETYPITVATHPWHDDRHQFFLEYKNFGPYSRANIASAEAEVQLVVDTVKKIEDIMKENESEDASQLNNAGNAAANALNSAESNTGDAFSAEKGTGKSDDSVTL